MNAFLNLRPFTFLLTLALLILNSTICLSQIKTVEAKGIEATMRNPIVYDRAQYVSEWLVLGNISAKWDDGTAIDFLSKVGGEANYKPKEGKTIELSNGSMLEWKKLQNPSKIVDIANFCNYSNTNNAPVELIVRYMYGVINRPNAGRSILSIGCDGGVKVWLNGKLVHNVMSHRNLEVDQDLIEVDLNQGDNYLLCKSVQTAWGKNITVRITEDANVLENTLQKVEMVMNENVNDKAFVLKSAKHLSKIVKQQDIAVDIYRAGGQSVFEKTIQRGDSVSVKYGSWKDGPYEIKYSYKDLNGLTKTDYLKWFKGDMLEYANEVINTAPDKAENSPEAITHRMLADFVKYRIGPKFSITDKYRVALLQPLLMEYAELKMNKQIRPGGFVRLAYVDDIDGTPQFCRCYIPTNYDPSKKTALIVFLHGYNPENPEYIRWWSADKRHDVNVDRYNYVLIEPHGRGNTQYTGIGDRDVLKCIQMAKEKLNIDSDRVYLTGESMGSEGTWRVATAHPELFAAIAPVYGGWDFRSDMSIQELEKLSERDKFLKDRTSTTTQLESLLNLPILVLHGDNDKIIDVDNSRYLVRMLERWGYNVRYIEVPEKGHGDLGMGDVIYPWLLQHTRNESPKKVRVRATDLQTASAYWVKVLLRDNGWQMINVEAEVLANNIIRVNSENVLEMVLTPHADLIQYQKSINVVWNGKILTFENGSNNKIILKSNQLSEEKLRKSPQLAGPIRDFTNTPFALVVGTISSDILMQKILDFKTKAFVLWWKKTQKFEPRIFKDTEISDEDLKKYSLFLIGGPAENIIAKQIEKSLPFEITQKSVSIHGKVFKESNVVLDAIYPSPFNPERYIRLVAPTSTEGLGFYNPMSKSLLDFDYTITGKKSTFSTNDFSEKSIEVATGLFNNDWKIDSSKESE